AFMRERTTKQTIFESSRPSDSHVAVDKNPDRYTVGYFSPGQWLRVVGGFGTFKIWSSGDGIHWGTADNPTINFPTPFTTVGLLVKKTESPRKIVLDHLEVRELSAITSLASQEARKAVPTFGNLSELDFGAWNHKVISSWPVPIEGPPPFPMEDWRRACAIRSLAESPWTSLSSTLVRSLLEEGVEMSRPIAERFRLLDEVSLLYNLRDGGSASAMVGMYERLGAIAAREGHPDPFGFTVTNLQTAPIWTESQLFAVNAGFTRDMLLRHAYSQEWKELSSVAHRTEFLMLESNPRRFYWWERDERYLLDWAHAVAHQHAPNQTESRADWIPRFSRSRQWQHPLVTQLSKEGYNVMAEFEAALTGEAYEDACRIITSAGRAGMAGLLPDSKDPDLLVSLPRAIAIAMREHPELQQTMRDRFGDVGRVRVREAMTRADVDAVEAATVRFYGTQAAAEAYRWLGNRALASGKFAQAAQAYQEAMPLAENALARDVQNRLRLSASLLGHEVPTEETSSIQIATRTWSGAEFQRMIEELRKTHARAETSTLGDWNTAHLAALVPPKPGRIQVVPRNQFVGDLGNGSYENRNTDWVARQMAVATSGDLMFVSNRFQVVCYQISDGKTRWSRGLAGDQGTVSQWTFLPMQPLVVGDRVFVRRLTKRGPELACLSKETGDVLWNVRPEHHVASDPVFVQNRLLAFVVTIPQSGMLQIELTSFHPESGDVLSQQPILHLRDEWNGHPPCQIMATNGKILCTIGGATLCCDPLGQPQWLQQQPWLPPEVDRYSSVQHHQPPIVMNGRVFVTQSSVKDIGCYELATGRELWSQPVSNIVRLVGIAGDRLVVQTEMGLVGFDQTTGTQEWRYPSSDLLYGILCGGDRLICSRVLDDSEDGKVCLVWLDAHNGREISQTLLTNLVGKDVRFGPLIEDGERIWALTARGYKEARRDLVELVQEPNLPPPGPMAPNSLTAWVDN
ncbi:MAG: PQQ-binding-like beta-propeller repeat protein, partial [Planctomycetaceae bacterium]|nr:PQQ-binding-like beta-propeller repeat protein [Planctomycetaceae bacterium]